MNAMSPCTTWTYAMKMNSEVNGLVVGHMRDGRCKYDPQAKQELIRQCLNPGVSVSRMAMQHGVNANLLRLWITTSRRTAISGSGPDCSRAVPQAWLFGGQLLPVA